MLCLHHPKSKSSKPLLSPRTPTTTTTSAPRTGPSHPPTPSPSPSPSPLLSPKVEPTSTSTTPEPAAATNKVEIHRLLGRERERERERERDSENAEETTQPPPSENPNNPALTTPSVTSTNTSTPPNPHTSTVHHHTYDPSTSPLPPSHATATATSPASTPVSTSIPPSLRSSESSVPTATTATTSARSTPTTSIFAPHQSQLHSQPLQQTSSIPSKRPAPPPSPVTASAPVGGGPGLSSSLGVAPGSHDPHHVSPPPAKKQSKWSPEEDQLIIRLRGDGMKWEDISKHLPGRSAISCRLHYQNYLERRSEWDEERRNKLARLYERFKPEMWSRVAEELSIPWRAAEAMHWQLGEAEMARRAGVVPFTLASSATAPVSSTSTAGPLSSSVSPSAHAAIRGHGRSRSTGTRHLNLSGATYGTPPPPPPPPAMEHERTLPSVAELTRGVPAWDLRGEGMAMDPRGPLSAHGYPGESLYGTGPQGPAYLRRSPERGPPPGSAHGRGGYGHGPPGPPPGSGRRF
ncbi:MAG: hypothetical protein Q9160_005309 [Pyrenula sp. 1 TL-2023]